MNMVKERRHKLKSNESNLALYFKEINKIPIMNRDEEAEVAKMATAGNKQAREKLVNSNLRFVVKIAKKYQGMGFALEDLIAEGNVGLVKAADRFDVSKGYHFISYAVWWIRQSILLAICQKSRMIRLPHNRVIELVKIERTRKMMRKHNSSGDEIDEIANILNMEKNHVTHLLDISREILSLENPVSTNHNLPLRDFLEDNQYINPEQSVEKKSLEIDIENALDTLDKNEADIIRSRYGIGNYPVMSLQEIGEQYNLSRERIRQIELKALTRLKNPVRNKDLRNYVA
ncbi:MAG: RNA polymerase sigma factor RpoD/SigA [Treponema sp.]|jgi:RNA polymerase primary sigma factor|nr:RNA polymerase sigma factor RpoD/SigA [Treponema sp.]